MSYFLHTAELSTGGHDSLTGEEARHALHARRSKIGEHIEVQTPAGRRYDCVITGIQKTTLEFTVAQEIPTPAEPAVAVTLCLAYINEQALDICIQKATELGAAALTIFPAANSPHAPKETKLARWQKISTEAAKQCGRRFPLTISTSQSLADTLTTTSGVRMYAAANAPAPLRLPTPSPTTVCIWVGPEGGFSAEEIHTFEMHGVHAASLPGHTLRSETAAITAIGVALSQAAETSTTPLS